MSPVLEVCLREREGERDWKKEVEMEEEDADLEE